MGPDGPKWGQEDFSPANPDLADILGDTNFDFENSFGGFFGVPNFWLGPSLGAAWISKAMPKLQIVQNVPERAPALCSFVALLV